MIARNGFPVLLHSLLISLDSEILCQDYARRYHCTLIQYIYEMHKNVVISLYTHIYIYSSMKLVNLPRSSATIKIIFGGLDALHTLQNIADQKIILKGML